MNQSNKQKAMPDSGNKVQSNISYYERFREQVAAYRNQNRRPIERPDLSGDKDELPRPLASIIVLNFNGEHIIERCLRHLLEQSYPNMEIVVVDNASSDNSRDILNSYVESGKIKLVKSSKNLGVAGGRNLGVKSARGDVIAFIDNDGYADAQWLEHAVSKLLSKSDIGAIASLVFFNRRKIVLNGAGGTINFRGYGGDHCFNAAYEIAAFPDEVLYPMGCGMVLRREVIETIGYLDELLFNYYDDVEIGIRTWRSGSRVVFCPDAWVDHDFSYSNKFNQNKVLLCERNRIRNAIKYFPTKHLRSWLFHERRIFRYLFVPGARTLPFRAWSWNIKHIRSALRIRRHFSNLNPSEMAHIYPSWESIPSNPDNQSFLPKHERLEKHISLGAENDDTALNFGWYYPEKDEYGGFRWTGDAASLYLRSDSETPGLNITFRGLGFGQRVTFQIRRLGECSPIWSFTQSAPFTWVTQTHEINLPAGEYEFLVRAETYIGNECRRKLGIAVRETGFGTPLSSTKV